MPFPKDVGGTSLAFIKNKANYTKSFLATSNKAALFFLGEKRMSLGNIY